MRTTDGRTQAPPTPPQGDAGRATAKARLMPLGIRAAAEAGVSSSARLLLAVLIGEAWPHDDGDGWAASRTTQAELGRLVGVNDRSVRRLLGELEAAGLVHHDHGAGSRPSAYVLCVTAPGCLSTPLFSPVTHDRTTAAAAAPIRSPMTAPSGHPRPPHPVTHDRTSPRTPISAQYQNSIISGEHRAPPNRGESQLPPHAARLARIRRLDGLAAVLFERIGTRPAWAAGRWIDQDTALELAEDPATTLEAVEAALAEAREIKARLSNPAGFVIGRIRTPDPDAVAALREKRRKAAEADEKAAAELAARRAADAAAHAVDAAARAHQDALAAEFTADELDALVDQWVREKAPAGERALLLHRTPAERRRALFRRCALARILEDLAR